MQIFSSCHTRIDGQTGVKVMVVHLKLIAVNIGVINRKIHHFIVPCFDDV
jgi:hypothetical protein